MADEITPPVNTDAGAAAGEETTTTPSTEETSLLTGGQESDSAAKAGEEGATEDDKAKAEDGEGGKKAEGEGDAPPGEYTDFTLPEGFELSDEKLAEVTPILQEMGLNQEQAQKLVDFYAKDIQSITQGQVESFNQLRQDWQTQTKSDKEIGGDKLDSTLQDARATLEKFGTPELKQVLNETGVGDHPEVIRVMARIGKLTREDVPGATGGQGGGKKDRVSILYPEPEE